MRTQSRIRTVAMALAVVLGSGAGTQLLVAATPVEDIRKELLQRPYYGVFDFLAFSYDKSTVTLMGYAYSPGLKKDAERAVRRVEVVKEIGNRIEELPVSTADDEIRWKAYYAIYRDPFLSRYAPGGGLLWGHRHPLGGGVLRPFGPGPFAGFELAGDYPIHIVVKSLRISLLGVVDNDADKNVAGLKARVSGSLGVDNQLMVEKASSTN